MEAPAPTTSRHFEFAPPEQPENSWEFLLFAWRRKWVVLLMATVGLGLGYLFFLRETPVYQSRAQILLVQRQAKLPIQGLEVSTGYDNTHEILIRSPMVVSLAVADKNIQSLPTLSGHPNPAAVVMSGLVVATESRDRQSGDVFELSYTSLSSQDCKLVLEAVIKAYEQFLSQTYENVSDDVIKFIEQAKVDLEGQIRDAEQEYARFRTEKSALMYAGQAAMNVHEPRMTQIEAVRTAAVLENSRLQAQIDAIETALEKGGSREALNLIVGQNQASGATGVMVSAGGATVEEQLFPQMLEEQMLLERYGSDHPKVQSLRKRMELTRQHMLGLRESQEATESEGPQTRDFLQVYLESLSEKIHINEQTILEMTELFNAENAQANALASDHAQDQSYQDRIDRLKKMYDVIINRLEEINIVKDTGTIKLQNIAQPELGYQIKPELQKIMLTAGMLGMLAGLGLAFLVDRADRRFRSPDEIRNDLGLPVVGHIPVIPSSESGKEAEPSENGNGQPVLSPVLRTHHHPRGRIAEAYRAVRTALYFSTRGGGHQVIQITSPSPGDGKTTLACNLAVSIAHSGKRGLLVDADFRRPRCHKVFGIENEHGVTSVLDGTVELDDVLQETGIPNLQLLPCGKRPANPSELITSRRFEELLAVLREKFEFVILDTPPVLVVTDPLNVVPRVDGVLLVMRLTKSARAASHRALASLEELGANMLGVVVNGVGGGATYGGYGRYGSGNYGYGGYGYGYGYGYGGYGNARYGYGGYGYGEYEYRYSDNDDKSYYEDADESASGSNGNGRKQRVRKR